MFWILLILVVLLIYRPKIFAVALLLLALFAISAYIYDRYFYTPPHEAFIKNNQLTLIGRQLSQQGGGIYAENASSYFLLYPANYYKTDKNKTCPGFNRLDKETWCGDEKFFPNCYPEDRECSSILINNK